MAAMDTSESFTDLYEQINLKDSYCLNENPKFTFNNALLADESLLLRSDADEELLLQIEFNDTVKLHSILIKSPSDGSAPKILKLFINRPSMGFSDVYDIEATQKIELSEEMIRSGKPIPLRFVKFQRVRTLTLFFQGDEDSEFTSISSLRFLGERLAGTNMNELKKVTEE